MKNKITKIVVWHDHLDSRLIVEIERGNNHKVYYPSWNSIARIEKLLNSVVFKVEIFKKGIFLTRLIP